MSIEAKKDGLHQTQDGTWRLTLTVNPSDMPAWLLVSPMSQKLSLTVAALEDNKAPVAALEQDLLARAAHARASAAIWASAEARSTQAQAAIRASRARYRSLPNDHKDGAAPFRFEDELPLSQQAALLCETPAFKRWVIMSPSDGEQAIKRYVWDFCGVSSRAGLDKYPDAGAKFRSLRDQFRTDCRPEQAE